jgi:hypothetical protein
MTRPSPRFRGLASVLKQYPRSRSYAIQANFKLAVNPPKLTAAGALPEPSHSVMDRN